MIANLLQRSDTGSWIIPHESVTKQIEDLIKPHERKCSRAFQQIAITKSEDQAVCETISNLIDCFTSLKESLRSFRHVSLDEIYRTAFINQLVGIAIAVEKLRNSTPLPIEIQELSQAIGTAPSNFIPTSTNALFDATDTFGSHPLHLAARKGQTEQVKFLIEKGASIDQADNSGSQPIHRAVSNGHKEVVELLLEKGAKVDASDANGLQPLHLAAERGYKEIVELLLKHGAKVNAATKDGMQPLHGAARDGHKEVVEMLLNKGATITATLSDRCQPLLWATINGHKEIVELLLSRGAHIDAADKFGVQSLHLAAMNGDTEMAELLLSKGADVDAADHVGKRPSDWAALYNKKEVENLLFKALILKPLFHVYRKQGYLTRFLDKTPFPIEESYISVTLVDREGGEEVEEAIKRNTNPSLFQGKRVELSKLFEDTTHLYIEGSAGSGKTTLCRYMVSTWANLSPKERQETLGPWTNRFEAIILLPLREIRSLSETADLNDLILKCYPTLSLASLNQSTTLYILDGFDEIASLEEICTKNEKDKRWDIVEALIKQPYWIVNSRPNLFSWRFFGCRRLRNSGFTNENVKAYVRRFCKDFKLQSQRLEMAISSKNELQVLSRTPLYLELICSLWKENPDLLSSLNRLSTLYDKITLLLFRRHLMRVEDNTAGLFVDEILTHEKVSPYRECLEAIAFHSKLLGGNRITPDLYQPLLKKIPLEEREAFGKSLFDKIGLLNPVGDTKELLEQNYAFVHLSFEEYFAARYLVSRIESSLPLIGDLSAVEWLKSNCFANSFEKLIDFTASLAVSNTQLNALVNALQSGKEEASEWSYPLHRAAQLGLLELVDLMLKKGTNKVDTATEDGIQPLHRAAERGCKEVVELLLNKGAKIDAADRGRSQPLHYAAEGGHKDVVELLLNKRAKIDATNICGQRPLLKAAEGGHKEVVEFLLNKGAKIDSLDRGSRQPIHGASERGHKEVVELLLSKGAKMDAATIFGQRPLHGALEGCNKEIVELLIAKGAMIDATDNYGRQPLHLAAKRGVREIVELLLSKGAKIDTVDNLARQPLHWAAKEGHKEIVELLLSKGVKIDAVDKEGRQPLHGAAERGRNEVVKLLLIKGAMIDAIDNDGRQPLHWAAKEGHKEIVTLLLSKGAKIDSASKSGWQPLHWAANHGHKEVVELLLNKGAKNKAVHFIGRKPIQLAEANGHKEIVELFLRRSS